MREVSTSLHEALRENTKSGGTKLCPAMRRKRGREMRLRQHHPLRHSRISGDVQVYEVRREADGDWVGARVAKRRTLPSFRDD